MRKPRPHERITRQIAIANIVVDDGPRPVDATRVDALAKSMARLGMHTPIVVELCDRPDGCVPQKMEEFFYKVITGRHRVAAARRLGWESIETIRFLENVFFDKLTDQAKDDQGNYEEPDFDIAARMWAIAENLHRAELTVLQRDEQIVEWIELERRWQGEVGRVLRQPDAKQAAGRPEGGVRAAARELGISEPDARRATSVASLSDDAKAAAREVGLDDNRTALLAAARAPVEQQAALVRDYAQRKQAKPPRDNNGDNTPSEAEEFAAALRRKFGPQELPAVITWLEVVKPRDVVRMLRAG